MNAPLHKDEAGHISISSESQQESLEEAKNPPPRKDFQIPEKESPTSRAREMGPPLSTSPLKPKERSLSMEMAEALEALQPADDMEMFSTPSSIKRTQQDVSSASDEDGAGLSTPTPTSTSASTQTVQALHRPNDQDIYSSDEDEDEDEDYISSSDLEIINPDASPSSKPTSTPPATTAIAPNPPTTPTPSKPSPPITLSTSTSISTPPSSPRPTPRTIIPRPTQAVQQSGLAPRKPWRIDYICDQCEGVVSIRGGGLGVYDEATGRNTDPMRCRECGCRMLWKGRTKRIVQFEAR
ncbi:hypothetical protein NX059_002108 [Plenodomus lindquistii]|nr:hypothetical protein NX059_002108 [Plenodomus lindquistii]